MTKNYINKRATSIVFHIGIKSYFKFKFTYIKNLKSLDKNIFLVYFKDSGGVYWLNLYNIVTIML